MSTINTTTERASAGLPPFLTSKQTLRFWSVAKVAGNAGVF